MAAKPRQQRPKAKNHQRQGGAIILSSVLLPERFALA